MLNTMIAPKSILLVEDDPSVADTMCLLLKVDRHRVEVVADGKSALAKYEEGKYDVVITDFRMPGMDGLEVAGAIKARAPGQPVLLVTAFVEAVSSREKERLRFVDGLLAKPFSPEELKHALRTVFEEVES